MDEAFKKMIGNLKQVANFPIPNSLSSAYHSIVQYLADTVMERRKLNPDYPIYEVDGHITQKHDSYQLLMAFPLPDKTIPGNRFITMVDFPNSLVELAVMMARPPDNDNEEIVIESYHYFDGLSPPPPVHQANPKMILLARDIVFLEKDVIEFLLDDKQPQ
jgi:hypothetical protein